MDANAREVWKARHRVSLRMRRQQQDAVNVHANQRAAAEASSFRTAWDAGNTEISPQTRASQGVWYSDFFPWASWVLGGFPKLGVPLKGLGCPQKLGVPCWDPK